MLDDGVVLHRIRRTDIGIAIVLQLTEGQPGGGLDESRVAARLVRHLTVAEIVLRNQAGVGLRPEQESGLHGGAVIRIPALVALMPRVECVEGE